MMRSAVLYPAKVEKLQEKFANIHHQLSSSQTVTHSQCDIIEESWRWTHSQRHFCNFIYQFPFHVSCWVLSTSGRRTSLNSNICRYHQDKCIHYYKYARGVSLCNSVLRSILFTSRAKMFHPRKQVPYKSGGYRKYSEKFDIVITMISSSTCTLWCPSIKAWIVELTHTTIKNLAGSSVFKFGMYLWRWSSLLALSTSLMLQTESPVKMKL